jgi:hypothetical protein
MRFFKPRGLTSCWDDGTKCEICCKTEEEISFQKELNIFSPTCVYCVVYNVCTVLYILYCMRMYLVSKALVCQVRLGQFRKYNL